MHKGILYAVLVVLLGGGFYYFVYPAFRTVERNDPLPVEEAAQVLGAAIVATPLHPASGSVRVLLDASGETIVRFEDYKTIDGPDLHVYLSKDLDAKDYIDLGAIRGTEGNINYEVPPGINADDYQYVLTWCEPFRVLFNYAKIN